MTAPPDDVVALARSLYHKEPGKEQARDWKEVHDRLRQINDRFRGGSDLARGFIDDYFATELGAKPNVVADGSAVFSFAAAMEAAMKQAEWMAEADGSPAGQHAASRELLDWYTDNVGAVTRGGRDRAAVPANADGSGAPPKLSAAEAWLHARLQEIDSGVSAGAAQMLARDYQRNSARAFASRQ